MKHMTKSYNVKTGSAKPMKPMSKRTQMAAGGKGPGYGAASASKHLASQDKMCPKG